MRIKFRTLLEFVQYSLKLTTRGLDIVTQINILTKKSYCLGYRYRSGTMSCGIKKIKIKCKMYVMFIGPDGNLFTTTSSTIDQHLRRHIIAPFHKYKVVTDEKKRWITLAVELQIDDAIITINFQNYSDKALDVIILNFVRTRYLSYISIASDPKRFLKFKQDHETTPIILYGYESERKIMDEYLQESLLKGYTLLNQARGDQLAHKVGAIKYVSCNRKSGRGAKILMDEIVYAHLGRFVKNEQMSSENCCVL